LNQGYKYLGQYVPIWRLLLLRLALSFSLIAQVTCTEVKEVYVLFFNILPGPVLNGLGQVGGLNIRRAGQIGDGPGQLQNPMIGPRAQSAN
jgi:hypothetical protein